MTSHEVDRIRDVSGRTRQRFEDELESLNLLSLLFVVTRALGFGGHFSQTGNLSVVKERRDILSFFGQRTGRG